MRRGLRPALGLVFEARVAAHLVLGAERVPEAQRLRSLGNEAVEPAVAGKAEDIAGAIAFSPCHRLVPAVVAVAAPDQAGRRPVAADALRQVPDDGAHLRALGRPGRTQDGDDRRAAGDVVDVHRREPALVVMRVPERELLAAVSGAERVIDIEDLLRTRRHVRAALVDQGTGEPRRIRFSRRILQTRDRRLRGQRRSALGRPPDGKLQQRIVPQPVEVVAILVAAGDGEGARRDEFHHLVPDAGLVAPIGHGVGESPTDTEPPLRLA